MSASIKEVPQTFFLEPLLEWVLGFCFISVDASRRSTPMLPLLTRPCPLQPHISDRVCWQFWHFPVSLLRSWRNHPRSMNFGAGPAHVTSPGYECSKNELLVLH